MGLWDYFRGGSSRRVEEAFAAITGMLDQGQAMFEAATAHLLDNAPLTVDLQALDATINAREQTVRRILHDHLGAAPRRDLVFCLKLASIVQEAERLGDLAKDLAGAAELADGPRGGAPTETLRTLRDALLTAFAQTRAGFAEENETVARAVMHAHEARKRDIADFLQALTRRTDLSPAEGVVYALAARLMSRVSSHLANIASTVVVPFDQIRRAAPDGLAEA